MHPNIIRMIASFKGLDDFKSSRDNERYQQRQNELKAKQVKQSTVRQKIRDSETNDFFSNASSQQSFLQYKHMGIGSEQKQINNNDSVEEGERLDDISTPKIFKGNKLLHVSALSGTQDEGMNDYNSNQSAKKAESDKWRGTCLHIILELAECGDV